MERSVLANFLQIARADAEERRSRLEPYLWADYMGMCLENVNDK